MNEKGHRQFDLVYLTILVMSSILLVISFVFKNLNIEGDWNGKCQSKLKPVSSANNPFDKWRHRKLEQWLQADLPINFSDSRALLSRFMQRRDGAGNQRLKRAFRTSSAKAKDRQLLWLPAAPHSNFSGFSIPVIW